MSDYSVFVGTQVKDRCDFCSTPIDDDNKYFDGEGDLELCEKCFYKVAPIPQQNGTTKLHQERRMSEWRPIETAPRDGTSVLIFGKWDGNVGDWDKRPPAMSVGRFLDGQWEAAITEYYQVTCKPTHWMPLPEPPKGETDERSAGLH